MTTVVPATPSRRRQMFRWLAIHLAACLVGFPLVRAGALGAGLIAMGYLGNLSEWPDSLSGMVPLVLTIFPLLLCLGAAQTRALGGSLLAGGLLTSLGAGVAYVVCLMVGATPVIGIFPSALYLGLFGLLIGLGQAWVVRLSRANTFLWSAASAFAWLLSLWVVYFLDFRIPYGLPLRIVAAFLAIAGLTGFVRYWLLAPLTVNRN